MRSSGALTPHSTAPKKTGGIASASTSIRTPPDQLAYIAWLTVCVVWGTTYLAIRVAIETLPPFAMSGTRWIIAGAVLLAALKFRGAAMIRVADWPRQVLLGTLLIGFGNGGVVWAEQWVPSGLASLLVTVTPFWLLGVERFTSRAEPLTRMRIAGFFIGLGGVALLVWPDLYADSGRGLLAGLLGTQAACFGWALGSNYSRATRGHDDLLVTSATQMVFGGIVMFIAAGMVGERLAVEFSGRSLAAFFYLIVVGSLIGFSAYTYALNHLPLSTVSLYAYINPLIAVILGTIVLGEPITLRVAIASAIVLGGTALVRRA